jgi:hypothetical protein
MDCKFESKAFVSIRRITLELNVEEFGEDMPGSKALGSTGCNGDRLLGPPTRPLCRHLFHPNGTRPVLI